ncbi:MAG: cytochrome c5 family protein [Chlorobium sp.]|nr:MAG: cytochrome c5 family protein [Chlorobium sp.]
MKTKGVLMFFLFMSAYNVNQQSYADSLQKDCQKQDKITVNENAMSSTFNITERKKKYTSCGCCACHDNSVMGAPKPGNKALWSSKMAGGWNHIVKNAIEGVNNMPAKGGNDSVSNKDIENIVAYMAS